jgi:hypothetical protein
MDPFCKQQRMFFFLTRWYIIMRQGNVPAFTFQNLRCCCFIETGNLQVGTVHKNVCVKTTNKNLQSVRQSYQQHTKPIPTEFHIFLNVTWTIPGMIYMYIDTGFTKCMSTTSQRDWLYKYGPTQWTRQGRSL